MATLRLVWDLGTAYDLFVSLRVLHEPARFGVRGAWAAGVRARIPAAERETLEKAHGLVLLPLYWLYALPPPKDAPAALWALGRVPPAERLGLLTLDPGEAPCEIADLLREVSARGAWSPADLEALRRASRHMPGVKGPTSEELENTLWAWAHSEQFGERYLESLRAYHEVFFAEEECRIRPRLQDALERARDLAAERTLPDLLEELSQGVRLDVAPESLEIVLAPSYWATPLLILGRLAPNRPIYLFGARPPEESLVPGEAVPDSMLRALKALSDPSRLRVLHYLSREPLSAAELSRRLRLRLPTVLHHLSVLRLAGLVQLSLSREGDREEMRYAARPGAVAAAFASLQGFLGE